MEKEKSNLAELIAIAIIAGTKSHSEYSKQLHVLHEKGDQHIDLECGIKGLDCVPVRLTIEFL